MSRCVSLTKKGDRCRNKALAGIDRCHIHAEKQSYVAPRVSDLKPRLSDLKPRVSDLKPKSLCDGKLCDGNKICNPSTGRCVSLTGNIGQKLIQGNEVKFRKPESKIQVKANKILKPKPEPVKAIKIFNPYLGEQVDPDEKDNCGSDRVTLDRIPKTSHNRNILSRYCDVLPLKDVKYIVGPNRYTEFRYKNYKIGIFGEGSHSIHDFPKSSKTDTLTFSAFLTSLVTQTKRQYDLFAELPYRNREVKARETSDINFMLNVLEYDFKDCLQVEKAACPYKNLRVHYTDRRFLYPERDNLAYKIYNYVAESINPNAQKPPGDLVNKFLKTAQEEYDKQTQFVERILQDKTSKIQTQLRNNELREKITSFIQKQMQANKLNCMYLLWLYRKTINKDFTRETFTPEDITGIRTLAYQFMYIFTPIMDTYLLGRIFRTYPKHSGGSAENIIIYGGSYHTDLYISFLNSIGANKTIAILNGLSLYYLEFRDVHKASSFLFNP